MALRVHRAERADLLVPGLAALLATPQADPFAREVVLVPAKGIERWLSQRLSHLLGPSLGGEDGVCAGVEFRSPASLVAELLGTREADPWSPDALVWPLLRVLDRVAGHDWARVLADHLGYDVAGSSLDPEERELRQGRRYGVARRLAGLFASYAVERPALLADWESGGDGDGGGRRLPHDLRWQPDLWRALVGEVGAQGGVESPGVRQGRVVAALRDGTLTPDLPPRVSLFGHSRLSRSEAELLAALGEARDVHLWLPHPSDALWAAGPTSRPGTWRADDESHLVVAHPLLATMGRDVREAHAVLDLVGVVDAGAAPAPDRPTTVLGALQSDLAAARPPAPSGLADDSVQVHACHGPARQVEVLREVLLGLLDEDPTLEPRDIVVMCPDIDAYAPLIQAAFGLGEAVAGSHAGHRLRVLLADRSPTQTNPLLGVLEAVLDLADGRAEATRVLDLLALPAVRRRWSLSDDDLEKAARWVTRSGVRWGWDAEGRERFGLEAFVQNTWRFGLDRVLAGVAMSDDSGVILGATAPLDDVSTTDIGLAGRLAEIVDRLQTLTDRLGGAHPAAHWLELLGDAVDQLAEPAPGEEWQAAELRRELARLTVPGAETGTATTLLRLGDIRAMLHRSLGGRPTRANFRTGTLTICTMTPMRSVPHRVVCLLGLDDGVFPRGGAIDGDDVLARLPMVGERDPRSSDRQLFLDAVGAATERLVITYTGFHEATGQPRPPSVPLREFLDVVETTTERSVVRRHRSQAFHTDYLAADQPGAALEPGLPPSYDPAAADAARAAAGERVALPRAAALRLAAPTPAGDTILLTDLVEAALSPTKAFLRQRLETELPREADEISDAMPVELAGLDSWQVGERMLGELRRGRSLEDAQQREWRYGAVPPGRYGWQLVRRTGQAAQSLAEVFAESVAGVDSRVVDVDVALPDGRRVVGSVPGVFGHRLVRVSYSRLRATARLRLWVELVAASAADEGPWVGRAIGRADMGDLPLRATYGQVAEPRAVLADLVALRDLALTRVVPVLPDSGRVWAYEVFRNRPARAPWEAGKQWREDNRARELLEAFGHRPEWDEVRKLRADDGTALFESAAETLWLPALRAEAE